MVCAVPVGYSAAFAPYANGVKYWAQGIEMQVTMIRCWVDLATRMNPLLPAFDVHKLSRHKPVAPVRNDPPLIEKLPAAAAEAPENADAPRKAAPEPVEKPVVSAVDQEADKAQTTPRKRRKVPSAPAQPFTE